MVKEVAQKFVRSKLVIFIVQFVLLSLLLFIVNYEFPINFDDSIIPEQQRIIQFLGNYVLYEDLFGFLFISGIWIGISLIPIIIFKDPRTSTTTNLKLFLFLNFFFYIFLSRYSPIYFKAEFWNLFIKTITLLIPIMILSAVLSYGISRLIEPKEETRIEDFRKVVDSTTYTCPNCGTVYHSIPKYCYKCLTEIVQPNENNITDKSS